MCKKSHFVERNRLCFPSRVPLGWRETPRQGSALGSHKKMELLSLGPPASQSCCWFRSGPIPSAGQAEHCIAASPLRLPFTSGTPVQVYGRGQVDVQIPASRTCPGAVRYTRQCACAVDHSQALPSRRGHVLPHLMPAVASFPHP